ncbi:MAG: hypothetical protein K2Q45_03210 [Nitrosomonas sp.]|nr:hypothetical protein [Nitrosomonas sp.]
MEVLCQFANDIKAEVYPESSESLSVWHDANPERILVSDGTVTFSMSKESAQSMGLGGNFYKI